MVDLFVFALLELFMLQNRCVNMIARLFHAPIGEDDTAVGVGTVGSSEAIMLAGLAFKRKWQEKRKSQGKTYINPNIVTGSNVQVCLITMHLLSFQLLKYICQCQSIYHCFGWH